MGETAEKRRRLANDLGTNSIENVHFKQCLLLIFFI
jgi:hypothetical protein